MSVDPKIRRRRFAFSLRTLFVAVTVACCWLGWERSVVHERQRVWRSIFEAGGYTLDDGAATVPTIRKWFGDRPREIIALPAERFSLSDAANIKLVFPEANVVRTVQETIPREDEY